MNTKAFLSPAFLTSAIYWVNGLAPAIGATAGPIFVNHRYKKSRLPDQQRRILVLQEVATQAVTLAIHLLFYFGVATLVESRLKGKIPAGETLNLVKAAVAIVGSRFGSWVVRPRVCSKLLGDSLSTQNSGDLFESNPPKKPETTVKPPPSPPRKQPLPLPKPLAPAYPSSSNYAYPSYPAYPPVPYYAPQAPAQNVSMFHHWRATPQTRIGYSYGVAPQQPAAMRWAPAPSWQPLRPYY